MKVQGNLKVSGTLEGITFTDGVHTFANQPKLNFDIGGFYLSNSKTDGRPVVNQRPTGISFKDGISTYNNQLALGFSPNFYLSQGTGGPVVNVRNPLNKSITLEFPGSAENIMIFRASESMRIGSVRAVLVGSASPSVTFQVKSGTDRSNLTVNHTVSTAVTNTTTGLSVALSTAIIPAGSFVCLVTTAQSGTVTEMDVSIQVEFV